MALEVADSSAGAPSAAKRSPAGIASFCPVYQRLWCFQFWVTLTTIRKVRETHHPLPIVVRFTHPTRNHGPSASIVAGNVGVITATIVISATPPFCLILLCWGSDFHNGGCSGLLLTRTASARMSRTFMLPKGKHETTCKRAAAEPRLLCARPPIVNES